MKLTEAEWAVMEALWAGESFSLGELTRALYPGQGWSKIERSSPAPYSAGAAREDCARQERDELLNKVYGGAAGDLIAAFLKETHISADEAARLRKLLDEMEV